MKKYKERSCFDLSRVERPTTTCDDCIDQPEDGVLWSIRSLFPDEEEEENEDDGDDEDENEDETEGRNESENES